MSVLFYFEPNLTSICFLLFRIFAYSNTFLFSLFWNAFLSISTNLQLEFNRHCCRTKKKLELHDFRTLVDFSSKKKKEEKWFLYHGFGLLQLFYIVSDCICAKINTIRRLAIYWTQKIVYLIHKSNLNVRSMLIKLKKISVEFTSQLSYCLALDKSKLEV